MKFSTKKPNNFKKLVRVVGLDNTAKLMQVFGGKTLYIPKIVGMIRIRRDEKIYRDHATGLYTHAELARKWGLKKPTLTKIINRVYKRKVEEK